MSFREWMDEMSRCLLTGGLALLTFHGVTAYEAFSAQGKGKSLNVSVTDWAQLKAEFHRAAFTWAPQEVQSPDVDTNSLGICFIDEGTLAELLPGDLKLVSYLPGALDGWQDLAVIRKT